MSGGSSKKIATTGQCPPEFLKQRRGPTAATPAPQSTRTMLEQWYLAPLGRMGDHEAFVCLCCCFPLYEKFLRATGKIGADEHFTEGHAVFDYLGGKWGCSKQVAFEVWSNWRNGLLHKAMVKKDKDFAFFMCGEEEFDRTVNERGTDIVVNPWKLRECLFNAIQGKQEIWKDDDYPFMKVYEHDRA